MLNLFDTPQTTPVAPAVSAYIAWDANGKPVAAQDGHKIRDSWETGIPCYNRGCDGELIGCLLFMGTQTGGLQIKRACPNCGMDFADVLILGEEMPL